MKKLRLLAYPLLPLLLGCAGPRGSSAAGPASPVGPGAAAAHDEGLLSEEDSYREPPARGAQRPPPTHLDDNAAADPPPQAAEPPPEPEPAPKGRVPYAGRRGVIARAELLQVLDQSPAAFLRRVDTEPRFEGGRFRGWAINAFYADDPRFANIDLRRGDVVTRVNGQPIEMPEQFIVVWQQLRQASELRVDLLRNGQPHVSRWAITD